MTRVTPLILIDVDNTLIDSSYQHTADESTLRDIISEVQDGGLLVGLNSDTPLAPLRRYAGLLGMKGPIVAENGQVVQVAPASPCEVLGSAADFFSELRRQFALAALASADADFVAIGDVTEFVRQRGRVYGLDTTAILINRYRQCSFSAFGLRLKGTQLMPDVEVLESIVRLLPEEIATNAEFRIDRDEHSGIVIVHERAASKTSGVARLQRVLGNTDIWMIGNGDADAISLPGVRLGAVGNATALLRSMAARSGGLVAKGTITQGVIELLTELRPRPAR